MSLYPDGSRPMFPGWMDENENRFQFAILQVFETYPPLELEVILLTADPVVACDEVSLASLRPGSAAIIVDVDASGPQGQRLLDLGFVPNTPIRVLRRAPLGDPSVYDVRGTRFCLRRTEAKRVQVRPA